MYKKLIQDYKDGMSLLPLSKKYQISTRKIQSLLKEFGIPQRGRSESQQLSLKLGYRQHPTKGKHHSENVKKRISNTIVNTWEHKSDIEKQKVSETSKKNWNKRSKAAKEEFQRRSNESIRQSAKTGSKMEKFLYQDLQNAGIRVQYHEEHLVANENMQIDMVLPEYMLAIELDGISHFEPIWGQETFEKTQRSDTEKNGHLISNGFFVLRIKNNRKNLSQKIRRTIFEKVQEILQDLNSRTEKLIYLEV